MEMIKKISDNLFQIFLTVFALGIFITWADFKIKIELPINDFTGFVVDSHENIYIGDCFYSLIQKYDNEGHFIESIRVKNPRGKFFKISIDKDDNIIVQSQIDKNFTVYPYYNRDKSFIIYNTNKSGQLKGVNTFFINLKKHKFENLNTSYPSICKLSDTKQKIVEQSFILKFLSLSTIIVIIAVALLMKLTLFIVKKLKN